jgi:hypothetical protein
MRTTTTITIVTLFLSSSQAFSPAGIIITSSPPAAARSLFGIEARAQSITALSSTPLDGFNREMLNNKKDDDDDDDDDVPMTKAEMREAAKEMKAEMKRLKDEAAAAATKEE